MIYYPGRSNLTGVYIIAMMALFTRIYVDQCLEYIQYMDTVCGIKREIQLEGNV